MMKFIHCLRTGEVLLDQNRHLFLLCINCHKDYDGLNEFHAHLETCTKLAASIQEYSVSGQNEQPQSAALIEETDECTGTANNVDLLRIEEELHNPRWYNNLTAPCKIILSSNNKFHNVSTKNSALKIRNLDDLQQKKTKTPLNKEQTKITQRNKKYNNNNQQKLFTQLKVVQPKPIIAAKDENTGPRQVKPKLPTTNDSRSFLPQSQQRTCTAVATQTKVQTQLSGKGCIKLENVGTTGSTNKTLKVTNPEGSTQYSSIYAKKDEQQLSNASIQNTDFPPLACAPKVQSLSDKEKQTAQILKKLNSYGLQIKRSQPPATRAAALNENTEMNRLVQKLISKGMNVKRICKRENNSNPVNTRTA